MSSENSIWYRLGYAMERARRAPSSGARKLATLKERRPERGGKGKGSGKVGPPHPADWPSADQLVASGLVAVVARGLDAWSPRHRTGAAGLLKAGVAGAAAALAVELVRPLLRGEARLPELDPDVADRVLSGAGQGLVYGAVVEPRLPGHPVLKGALYASAEYAVGPMGGLSHLLGRHAPLKGVPVLGSLLEGGKGEARSYTEHLAFGVALALVYGSVLSRSGILDEDGA